MCFTWSIIITPSSSISQASSFLNLAGDKYLGRSILQVAIHWSNLYKLLSAANQLQKRIAFMYCINNVKAINILPL
jgi:hypothetical protein